MSSTKNKTAHKKVCAMNDRTISYCVSVYKFLRSKKNNININ